MKIKVFQTLEDRDNADDIETHGPFKCTRTDAWLGEGYYFWENYIELAHFWGTSAYSVSGYIICQADGMIDENCFDLYNNPDHKKEFEEILLLLINAGIVKEDEVLVNQVINYFKAKGKFKYNSIRALGNDSISNKNQNNTFIKRMVFKKKSKAYLDLRPQIQICLLEKKALSLRNYSIVYPEKYTFNQYA